MEQVRKLNNESEAVIYLKNRCPRLSRIIDVVGEITYVPYSDYYAFLVHAIIEQMLSVKVGKVLYERLEVLCGGRVEPNSVIELSFDEIHSIGLSRHKVSYILSLTESIVHGALDLGSLYKLSDQEIIRELKRIKGIGSWTAKMFLIFCLDRPDVLPFEDLTFVSTYKWAYNARKTTSTSISRRLKKWKPYSSIGARYLYKAFDSGLTKHPLFLDSELKH